MQGENRTTQMKRWTMAAMCVGAAWLGAGCGGAQPRAQEPAEVTGRFANPLKGAPKWAMLGCNAFDGAKKPICGVGSVGGTRNFGLARDAAVGRARTDLARNLEVEVKSMLKDYQATTTGGQNFGNAASDEQHIEEVSKQLTNSVLRGTEVAEIFAGEDGTVFALVVLKPEAFQDAVNGMKQLPEAERRAVVEHSKAAHEELDKLTASPR